MFLFSSFNTLANAASARCFGMFKNVYFFMSGHDILHFSVKLIGMYVFHLLFYIYISIKWCENQCKIYDFPVVD